MVPSRFVLLALALIFFAGGHEASDDGSMVQSAPVRIVEASAASDQAEHSIIVGSIPRWREGALPCNSECFGCVARRNHTDIVRWPDHHRQARSRCRRSGSARALPGAPAGSICDAEPPRDAFGILYNDPQVSAQWALSSTSSAGIRATLAWDQTTGSATTLVGVMDTGIDYTHADLISRSSQQRGDSGDSRSTARRHQRRPDGC